MNEISDNQQPCNCDNSDDRDKGFIHEVSVPDSVVVVEVNTPQQLDNVLNDLFG